MKQSIGEKSTQTAMSSLYAVCWPKKTDDLLLEESDTEETETEERGTKQRIVSMKKVKQLNKHTCCLHNKLKNMHDCL